MKLATNSVVKQLTSEIFDSNLIPECTPIEGVEKINPASHLWMLGKFQSLWSPWVLSLPRGTLSRMVALQPASLEILVVDEIVSSNKVKYV